MPIEIRLSTLAILTLLLFLSCASAPNIAKVTRVIDGDTIVIQGGQHIRYIGIDTPEIGEPYYAEAKQANRELVEGKEVRLEKDVTSKDRYGRWLRYVYVEDILVNAELVKQGYAYVYPKSQFPDIKYYDVLKDAEASAQQKGRGLWFSHH